MTSMEENTQRRKVKTSKKAYKIHGMYNFKYRAWICI